MHVTLADGETAVATQAMLAPPSPPETEHRRQGTVLPMSVYPVVQTQWINDDQTTPLAPAHCPDRHSGAQDCVQLDITRDKLSISPETWHGPVQSM